MTKEVRRMSKFSYAFRYLRQYNKYYVPVIKQRVAEYGIQAQEIRARSQKACAANALDGMNKASLIYSLCALYPGVDTQLLAQVSFSYQALLEYLIQVSKGTSNNTEAFIRLIFDSLKYAANLDMNKPYPYFTFYPTKDDNGYLNFLVDRCRRSFLLLPSFHLIENAMKNFQAQYCELAVTMYSESSQSNEEKLTAALKSNPNNFEELTNWEYLVASDSSLTVHMLLAIATIPDIDSSCAQKIEQQFFPWISGLQRMLSSYENYCKDMLSKELEFLYDYQTMKECEDKISAFIEKQRRFGVYKDQFYNTVATLLFSIYLSSPFVKSGMSSITTKRLLQLCEKSMFFYFWIIRLSKNKLASPY